MDKILNFLGNNYIYFLIGSVVLLLFLIGYIVVEKKNKKKEENTRTPAEAPVVTPTENVSPVQPMQSTPVESTMTVETPVEAPNLDALNSNVAETPVIEATSVQEPASIFDKPDTSVTMEQTSVPEPSVVPSEVATPISETPISEQPVVETPAMETNPVVEPVAPTVETATPQDVVMQTAAIEPVVPTIETATPQDVVMQTAAIEPVEAPVMEAPTPDVPVVEMPAAPVMDTVTTTQMPATESMETITPQNVVMETQPAETPNATKEPVQESTVPEVEVTTQNINQNM